MHPLTHLFCAVSFLCIVLGMPPLTGFVLLLAALFFIAAVPSRTRITRLKPFLKLLFAGAVFLALIHGIRWYPPGLDRAGFANAFNYLVRIGAVFVAILSFARQITSDDLYALLLDLRIPAPIILILFRTMWLVPRFVERTREVTTAQRLRGMRTDTPLRRFRAVLPALTPIVVSMLYETYDYAMTMTIRGFLAPGVKTHVHTLRFTGRDAFAAVFFGGGALLVCLMRTTW